MALSIVCPKCRKTYNLPDNLRGKSVKCKQCGQAMGGNGTAKSAAGPRPVAVGKTLPPSRQGVPKPPPIKEKSKAGLIAVLAIVGILLLGGGGLAVLFMTSGHKGSETQVADAGSTPKTEQATKPTDVRATEKSTPPPPPPPPPVKPDPPKVDPKPAEVVKPKDPEKPKDPVVVPEKPKDPPKPAADDALGKLLNELDDAGKRQDGGAVVQKLNALAQLPRDDKRAVEVSQALNIWLNPDWPDGNVTAERALKVWITPENIVPLGKLLERQDKNQAGPTLDLLAQTKEPAAAELIATRMSRPDEQEGVFKILQAMGPAGLKGWLYGGSSENEVARTTSRKTLKELKVTDADIVTHVAADVKMAGTPERRQWSAEWLSQIPVDAELKKPVVAALESLFLDGNPKVREAAVKSVALWATTKEDVPTLIVALDNPSTEARSAVLMVLAKLKDDRVGTAVAACLPTERALAAPILKAVGKSAEKAVAVWINHPDAGVREDAAKLLADYKTNDAIIAAVCVKDLQSTDNTTRSLAAQRLVKTKPTEAIRADVIEGAKTFLTNPDGNVRAVGAQVLGAWGNKEVVPYLLEKMEEDATRPGAMEALGMMKDPRGAEAVAKRLAVAADRPLAVKSLQAMGPAAEDALIAVLKDKEKEEAVTIEVCKILQQTGTKKSLTPLRALANDKNKQVVQVAGEAFKAITARGK